MVNLVHWRLRDFDNIEFAASERMTHVFPLHFHYEYMIGVSTAGLQEFADGEGTYIVPPRSILVTNPMQLHAHYPLNDIGWSHRSLYLSPDLMHYLQPAGGRFGRMVVQDEELFAAVMRLHDAASRDAAKTGVAKPAQASLADKAVAPLHAAELGTLVARLFAVAGFENGPRDSALAARIVEVREWVSDHCADKLGLDGLAARFSWDKYQLIRQFRKYTGVTPNAYLKIVRVERARRLLRQQVPVVEAALEAGFYDQAHFHHAFLEYTGMRPATYRGSAGFGEK